MSAIERSRVKNAPLETPDGQSDFVSWAMTVEDGSVSAGWQPMHPHLTHGTWPDPRRLSLGKFIELSRRRMRMSVEQLAEMADVDLAELLAVEKGEDVQAEAGTFYRLAAALRVRPESLLELAGLGVAQSVALTESAVRFAARLEPMDALTKEEEEALNWFEEKLAK